MIIYDAHHRIQRVNTEAENLFGYSRHDLIGSANGALVSREWYRTKSTDTNEILCVTKAGVTFPAEVSLKHIETGDSGHVVTVIRDITERRIAQENARRVTLDLERQVAERTRELVIDIAERKRAEQALRESEQSLRVAIQAAALGLWRIDMERGVMQISPLTCEIFGRPEGVHEIPLAEWKELICADDRTDAIHALERCASNLCDYESEYRIVHPDGAQRWIFAKGQAFRGPEDSSVLVVGIAQDITHRRLAQEADRHRQKLESLGILAGGIAHDFNNLLTGILGNASLLLETTSEGSFEEQSLSDLVSAAERAAQLTRQMLAYSGRG